MTNDVHQSPRSSYPPRPRSPTQKTSRSALIPGVAPPAACLPRDCGRLARRGLIIIAFLLFLGGSAMTDRKGHVDFHPQAKGVKGGGLYPLVRIRNVINSEHCRYATGELGKTSQTTSQLSKRILPKHPAAGLAAKPGKPQCRRRCCGRRRRLLQGVTFGGASSRGREGMSKGFSFWQSC